MARFGHLPLPPGLQVLEGWPVIVASLALFGVEFFADSIPAFDLIRKRSSHVHSRTCRRFVGVFVYQPVVALSTNF